MNIVNSEILNNDNINLFEHYAKQSISNLRLEYRLSDYNKGYDYSISDNEAYERFKLCCSYGVDHDLVILCKTVEGKIFGLYLPKVNYYVRITDKRKPYIFSIDVKETIGNGPNCYPKNRVWFEFESHLKRGIFAKINGYKFYLFEDGNAVGQVSSTIENIQKRHNIAYDIFGSVVNQDDNRITFQLNYIEIEVYQLKHNINPINSSIVTNSNRRILNNLIPLCEMKLLQSRTKNEYYVNYNLTSGYMYNINILVMVKTTDNKVFGVFKSDNEAYFYSVDLNCRYSLTGVKILVDTYSGNVIIDSNDIYLELAGGKDGRTGYVSTSIEFNDEDLIEHNTRDEIFGQLNYIWYDSFINPIDDGVHRNDRYFLQLLYPQRSIEGYMYMNSFKWLQVDVYRILD